MNKKITLYSLRLLQKRSYSEFKLRHKIKEKHPKVSLKELDELLNYLKELRYINDEEYRRSFIKSELYKNNAPNLIQYKIKERHRIPCTEEDVYQVMKDEHFHLEEMAKNVLRKKEKILHLIRECRDYKEKQKLMDKAFRALVSKGYQFDFAQSMIREVLK